MESVFPFRSSWINLFEASQMEKNTIMQKNPQDTPISLEKYAQVTLYHLPK